MANTKNTTCDFDGCDRKRKGHGLCATHLMQRSRGKYLTPIVNRRELTVQERFWTHVDKTGTCWVWTGATARGNYGAFNTGERMQSAHRFSWELFNGPIPDNHEIDHACFNSRCVNPSHLRPATRKQNGEYRQGAQANNRRSGVRGVYWSESSEAWMARVKHHGEVHHLGVFPTVEEAGAVVKAKRAELFTFPEVA